MKEAKEKGFGMKKMIVLWAATCLLVLAVSYVLAGAEEDSIQKIITDVAKAVTDFPKTRDIHSIVKYYSNDFVGIDDGAWYYLRDMERQLLDLNEGMSQGRPIGISNRVSNIDVHVNGTLGWATYINLFKLVSNGEVVEDSQSKCTAIFQKKEAEWLILHEHCSTPQNETNV